METTTLAWAKNVPAPVTPHEVELHVLGIDEESFDRHRDEDARHAHPLRRLRRIVEGTVGAIWTAGPFFAFLSIADRSQAKTRSYDFSPATEYLLIFVAFSFASAMLLSGVSNEMRGRRTIRGTFAFCWVLFNYVLVPVLTFMWVDKGPDTPPVWMIYPTISCAVLGVIMSVFMVLFSSDTEKNEQTQHMRDVALAHELLRRGRLDVDDLGEVLEEALLRERSDILDILVQREVMPQEDADAAKKMPLGAALS